jgi:hypothetical protein
MVASDLWKGAVMLTMGATLKREFRLRFEPLRRHLIPYEFPCDSRGQVDVDALDDGSLLQYLYVRGLLNIDYCLPRMVDDASL